MDKAKLFGKLFIAGVTVTAGPAIVQAAISALTQSGLAATTFGNVASFVLGATLLYLNSPTAKK